MPACPPLVRLPRRLARRLPAALLVLLPALLPAPVGAAEAGKTARPPASKPARAAARAARPAPAAPAADAAAAARQRDLQDEQRRLHARLGELRRQLAAAAASHSEATDSLRESEAAISRVNRRLRELSRARTQVERQIAVLRERSRGAAARQGGEERQLGQLLRSQYALARQPDWQHLLEGRDPQQVGRELAYLDYLARARAQSIGALRERRDELAALESESRGKQAELDAIARDEQAGRAQLLQEQQARRRTLDRLARQIGSQRQSIATLERDEKRLGGLVEEIGRLLAEQARRERQRAAQAARAAADRPPPGRASGPAAPSAEAAPEPAADARLAQLRGKLLLPVKGEVTARFGSPRRTEAGVNAPTWKGVFIRAAAGTEVHAVAAGRVVFADWLRGFGNLLILDHGDGLLSVYGNNEALLANIGEKVDAGEVIAAVGNTGGSSESGLYFELRLLGRALDPLRWAAAR